MALDIISYSKAQQALKKAGFVGTKPVDETNIDDGYIVQYSEDLDKYITREMKTKVNQWRFNHLYEKGEIVVFDDILYWVLEDHLSHATEIEVDVLNGKIIPFVTEAGLANVIGAFGEVINDGEEGKIEWTNPSTITYEGREVFMSETLDLTVMRYDECLEAVDNDQAEIVDQGIGTGEGNLDSYIFIAELRKRYYFKIFTVHFVDEEFKRSTGRGALIENPDIYPPASPTNVQATVVGRDVEITWTQPSDEDFFYTKVVRSTVDYPTTPSEGTVLGTVGESGVFNDVLPESNINYYYTLFSYDDAGNGYQHGVEGNMATSENSKVTVITYDRLGFDFNSLERLESAEGLEREDFDTIYPWSEIKRAVVNDSGVVLYYLDEDNSSFKEDGVTPAVLTGEDGNVVVEIPEFYYEFVEGKAFVSTGNFTNSVYSPRIIVGAFEAFKSESLGEMQSIVNQIPTTGESVSDYRVLVGNIGEGWQQLDVSFLSLLKILFAIEYGALNSQALVGMGVVTGQSEVATGKTLSLGNKSGVGANSTVSYRGIENPWGNTWEFVEGLVVTDTSYYTAENGFGSFVSDGNHGSYTPNGVVPITEDGYISEFIDDGIFVAEEVEGTTNAPVGDHQYSHREGEINISVHGGNYEDGERAGLFRIHMGVKKFAVSEEMDFVEEFTGETGGEIEEVYTETGVYDQDMTVDEAEGKVYIIDFPKSLVDENILAINKIEVL